MSIATLILGESGTGKSASMRNLDPAKTLLIQPVRKPLPFRSKEWEPISKDGGSVYVTSKSSNMVAAIQKAHERGKKIVVIDDFQYIMALEFFNRRMEKGYEKYTEIGGHAFDVLDAASKAPEGTRVYIMSHTESDDYGRVKAKTIGKMLDEKLVVEGMFTMVLRTTVRDGEFMFSTINNGQDTVKAPMGLFDIDEISNDLASVDSAICDYYGI